MILICCYVYFYLTMAKLADDKTKIRKIHVTKVQKQATRNLLDISILCRFLWDFVKLIALLPSSRCFLYGFTETICYLPCDLHSIWFHSYTPTLHHTRSGWQDLAFDTGSALISTGRCRGEHDVISVYRPAEHWAHSQVGLQVAYLTYKKL